MIENERVEWRLRTGSAVKEDPNKVFLYQARQSDSIMFEPALINDYGRLRIAPCGGGDQWGRRRDQWARLGLLSSARINSDTMMRMMNAPLAVVSKGTLFCLLFRDP